MRRSLRESEGGCPHTYHLTPFGRRAVEIETRELSNVLDVARLKRVIR